MSQVHLQPLNKIITVGKEKTLYQQLKHQQIPIASSCGGEAVCGKCIVKVLSGCDQLPAPNLLELNLIKKFKLSSEYRISCQLHVFSDIEIQTEYW